MSMLAPVSSGDPRVAPNNMEAEQSTLGLRVGETHVFPLGCQCSCDSGYNQKDKQAISKDDPGDKLPKSVGFHRH